jgi:hypothetical protein
VKPGHFVFGVELKNGKTKKVAGVDLNAECFLYSPDPENTSVWLFPVLVRGNDALTRNLITMHLHNFDARTAALSESLRQELWDMLRGCAVTHGLRAERRVFAAKNEEPTRAAEPPPPVEPPKPAEPVIVKLKKDPALERLIALADRRADELLRAMGLE